MMDIFKAQKIHCIGIGGIGVSSIAQILLAKGKIVSGSDMSESEITKSLKQKGVAVFKGHKAANIKKGHDLVIYSPAIPRTNPERVAAGEMGIKTMSYPQALGQLTKKYFTIAVAGTHGKSTTTAMTAQIAEAAGMDPTVVIGTKMDGKNFRVGKSDLLIVEACEYKGSFLKLWPDMLLITNLEADHLDHYKTLARYKEAFCKLVARVPEDGGVIIKASDKNSVVVVRGCGKPVIAWEKVAPFKLKIPGEFNLENATFAATAMANLGVPIPLIAKTLENFKGTWRRMEQKGKCGRAQLIDDYAHHPTEIRATLGAIRKLHPRARILCIFQPHQYSRTRLLFKDFTRAFGDADSVIIPGIYRVRDTEKDVASVSAAGLAAAIPNAQFIDGLEATAEFVKAHHAQFDIIVTMGAGNIGEIYKELK